MRIVVSGTHASGKSTLISDFAAGHAGFQVIGDPFEEIADLGFMRLDAALFMDQLEITAARLEELDTDAHAIIERGPLDFLAYLDALDALGRTGRSRSTLRSAHSRTAQVATRIDLSVIVPLDPRIPCGEDEDLELRAAMDHALLDLSTDQDLTGTRVLEVAGTPYHRLEQLERCVGSLG